MSSPVVPRLTSLPQQPVNTTPPTVIDTLFIDDLVECAIHNHLPKPIGIEDITRATLTLMLRKDLNVILVTGQPGSGKSSLMHGVAYAISQMEHIRKTTAFLEWDINSYHHLENKTDPIDNLENEIEDLFKALLMHSRTKENLIVLIDSPLPYVISYQQLFDTLGNKNFFGFTKTKFILPIDPDNQPGLLKLLEIRYCYKTGIVDLTKQEHRIFPEKILQKILSQQAETRKKTYTNTAIPIVIQAVVAQRNALLQTPQSGATLSPTLSSDIANLNTIMETANTVSDIQQHKEVTEEDVKEALRQLTLLGNLPQQRPLPDYLL
ncbi:MAG: hypothetical protein RLZZ453_720 [Chlamydiota bacterium]|jgi:energy-coupling factor transporter ATP-binding protein EcfA2